jgi:hypothetical protein
LLSVVLDVCRLLCCVLYVSLCVRRYVDRLSSNLHRKAGQEAKMLAAAAETQARQQESRAMLASLQPKVRDRQLLCLVTVQQYIRLLPVQALRHLT